MAKKATSKVETATKTEETKTTKKTAPKKVAPKKPASVVIATEAAKNVAGEKEVTNVNFFVEFAGKQVSVEEVINNIKNICNKDVKEISVYLKPEESKAYFVADGEASAMDVYFC